MAKKEDTDIPVNPEEVTEERLEEIRKKLGEALDAEDIGTSIVIFTHDDVKDPQVWRKGHWYDAAALLSEILAAYKMKAARDLGF